MIMTGIWAFKRFYRLSSRHRSLSNYTLNSLFVLFLGLIIINPNIRVSFATSAYEYRK